VIIRNGILGIYELPPSFPLNPVSTPRISEYYHVLNFNTKIRYDVV